MPRILMNPGPRTGRTVQNEGQLRAKLAEGHEVYILKNGVYFEVSVDGASLRFVALLAKPDGLP